jgi:hypothetical protein
MKGNQHTKMHRVDVLLKDAAVGLCQQRRCTGQHVNRWHADYFRKVVSGTHIIGREYAFISSMFRKRLSGVITWE